MFPSGSLVAVASGPEIFIWDIVGGGRLLNRISNFQKTVLCLEYATAAGSSVAVNAQPRLLAGSLDCHVKMYDIENFQVTSNYRQLVLLLLYYRYYLYLERGQMRKKKALSIRRYWIVL